MYQCMLALQTVALATGNPFNDVAAPITDLIDMALMPALSLVAALGAIYCVILGAKLAKAEEPQDHEKAKKALKNAILGFLLIFILLAALKIGMGSMKNWYSNIKADATDTTWVQLAENSSGSLQEII